MSGMYSLTVEKRAVLFRGISEFLMCKVGKGGVLGDKKPFDLHLLSLDCHLHLFVYIF